MPHNQGTGSIQVGPGGVRRLDPRQITQQVAGMRAQDELGAQNKGSAMSNALRMSQAELGGVQGTGAAAEGPSGWNALGTMLERSKGQRQLSGMKDQANVLRGTVEQGRTAQLQRGEDIAQRDFDYRTQLEQQRTDREDSARREVFDREDATRKNVEMIGPNMEKKTIQVDQQGRGYVDGEPINISEWTKANRGLGQKTLKPTGGQVDRYNEASRLLGELDKLAAMSAAMSDEARSELDSPVAETLISMIPGAAPENLAKGAYYKNDSVRDYKTASELITTDLSKLQAGLALSGFEIKERQKWDFSAPGITSEEKARRIKYVRDKFLGMTKGYERFYPDYTPRKEGATSEKIDALEKMAPTSPEASTALATELGKLSTEELTARFEKQQADKAKVLEVAEAKKRQTQAMKAKSQRPYY